MGWIGANLFLLATILVVCGYCWISFLLLRILGLSDSQLLVVAAFIGALVAAYFTMKRAHAFIAKRI
jgi:hypothetical protein